MREIVLDTETTGLDPADGHRIVEIGAVELFNHVPTGRTYHEYINPERDMPDEAYAVHGIGADFLADKPVFAALADGFLAFCGTARLVIHNAAFDIRFLDFELARAGRPQFGPERALDTLALARQRFPGAPASLDALCRRFGIDNSARTRHGALLDSEILAEIYLELIGGRQPGLSLVTGTARETRPDRDGARRLPARPEALPARLSPADRAAHAAFVEDMGPEALWRRFDI